MEGRARAALKRDELLISGAWHSGAFGGAAQAGKLKPLKHYISSFKPRETQKPSEMLAVLRELNASGAGMTFRRVSH